MIKRQEQEVETSLQVSRGNTDLAVDSGFTSVGGLDFGGSSGLSSEQVGGGFDNVGAEDLAVPILRLMQSASPECQGKSATSKAGTFEISTLEIVVDPDQTDLWFIPARFDKAWVERRKIGNGAPEKVAIYETEEQIDKTKYTFVPKEMGYFAMIDGYDHYIKLRHQHTGLVIIPERNVIEVCTMYLSSTAIPNSKQFLSMCQNHAAEVNGKRQVVHPSAQLFKITAEEKSNGQRTWFVPKFNRVKTELGGIVYAPAVLTQQALSLKKEIDQNLRAVADEEDANYVTVDITERGGM